MARNSFRIHPIDRFCPLDLRCPVAAPVEPVASNDFQDPQSYRYNRTTPQLTQEEHGLTVTMYEHQ